MLGKTLAEVWTAEDDQASMEVPAGKAPGSSKTDERSERGEPNERWKDHGTLRSAERPSISADSTGQSEVSESGRAALTDVEAPVPRTLDCGIPTAGLFLVILMLDQQGILEPGSRRSPAPSRCGVALDHDPSGTPLLPQAWQDMNGLPRSGG